MSKNIDEFQRNLLRDSLEYSLLRDKVKELIFNVSKSNSDVGYELFLLAKILGNAEKLCKQIHNRIENR